MIYAGKGLGSVLVPEARVARCTTSRPALLPQIELTKRGLPENLERSHQIVFFTSAHSEWPQPLVYWPGARDVAFVRARCCAFMGANVVIAYFSRVLERGRDMGLRSPPLKNFPIKQARITRVRDWV